jgi:hypothetical protein
MEHVEQVMNAVRDPFPHRPEGNCDSYISENVFG